jgi:hypothetical protein
MSRPRKFKELQNQRIVGPSYSEKQEHRYGKYEFSELLIAFVMSECMLRIEWRNKY